MSNVPAYPKNPLLHAEEASPVIAEDFEAANPTYAEGSAPVESRDIALYSPASLLNNTVRIQPVRALLIAAGIGYLAGRFVRL
ncbi:hypothetical protein [Luteolibacter soli]|uniref:Uncharacterized protein n=1 Tax=Luteolibacter soli TaxID=3135280 RepID=A0ABU9B252_9BACT